MRSLLKLVAAASVVLAAACSDQTEPIAPMLGDAAGAEENPGRWGGGEDVSVYSQNLYVGADVDAVITALATPDPDDDIPALLDAVGTLERTDFPARARALAKEVRRRRPDVIGLQEVSIVAVDIPPLGVSVHLDFLEILQAALAAEGLQYSVAVSGTNFVAAPAPGISLTDLDVILVDSRRVQVLSSATHVFSANLGVVAPGVNLQRGWVSIVASISGQTYTIANTHTEGTGPEELLLGLHQLQVSELVASIGTSTPAIVMGDFNTTPGTPAYAAMQEGGFVDLWGALHPGARGFTCCHLADLSDAVAPFQKRIDYIWTRGLGDARGRGGVTGQIERYGDVPSDRIRNSAGDLIWPSDHAGLTANVLIRRGGPHT
jgi:endonuclease/exonuclease/phosphatase family metal-dependent hydrolase